MYLPNTNAANSMEIVVSRAISEARLCKYNKYYASILPVLSYQDFEVIQ